jgi:hypothetical protein
MPYVAAAAAIFGAAKGAEASEISRKAAKEGRKRSRAQQRQAEIKRARERRKAAAEARRERARTIAEAAGTGAIGTSAVAGALSSISAQAAERLGFSTVVEAGGKEQLGFAIKESQLQTQAATTATQGQIVSSFGGFSGFEPSQDTTKKG